ncbi:MAG: hypothetical protein ACR2PO_00735 [Methyloligellaceae bacterium]
MSEASTPKLLVLAAGLFADRGTVEDALRVVSGQEDVQQIELDPSAMTEEDWDRVAGLILSAERVVTL